MSTQIRKEAAAFYLAAAKGTSVEEVMTERAAKNLGAVFEVCHRSELRRNANKVAKETQPLGPLTGSEILTLVFAAVALLASGFLN